MEVDYRLSKPVKNILIKIEISPAINDEIKISEKKVSSVTKSNIEISDTKISEKIKKEISPAINDEIEINMHKNNISHSVMELSRNTEMEEDDNEDTSGSKSVESSILKKIQKK